MYIQIGLTLLEIVGAIILAEIAVHMVTFPFYLQKTRYNFTIKGAWKQSLLPPFLLVIIKRSLGIGGPLRSLFTRGSYYAREFWQPDVWAKLFSYTRMLLYWVYVVFSVSVFIELKFFWEPFFSNMQHTNLYSDGSLGGIIRSLYFEGFGLYWLTWAQLIRSGNWLMPLLPYVSTAVIIFSIMVLSFAAEDLKAFPDNRN